MPAPWQKHGGQDVLVPFRYVLLIAQMLFTVAISESQDGYLWASVGVGSR